MKAVATFVLIAFSAVAFNLNAQTFTVYEDGLLDQITPKGWLKDFLVNQQEGMTGKPESMSYPYDSNLWDGEIVRNTETYGSDCLTVLSRRRLCGRWLSSGGTELRLTVFPPIIK